MYCTFHECTVYWVHILKQYEIFTSLFSFRHHVVSTTRSCCDAQPPFQGILHTGRGNRKVNTQNIHSKPRLITRLHSNSRSPHQRAFWKRLHLRWKVNFTRIRSQVHKSEAFTESWDEERDKYYEQTATSQVVVVVGRIRIATRNDPHHGTVSWNLDPYFTIHI